MSHFSGYGSYVVFVSIRTHFLSPTFDIFKHQKVKATKASYEKRVDKWFFDKLAKQYTDKELKDFFIANRLEDRNYVTELLGEDAHETFIRYKSRRQSLTYHFTNQLDILFKNGIKEAFEVPNDSYPFIINHYLGGKLSSDTLVIVNDFIPFFCKFDKYMGKDDPIWPKIALKLRKYKPFLKYDNDKFKRILKEKIDGTNR